MEFLGNRGRGWGPWKNINILLVQITKQLRAVWHRALSCWNIWMSWWTIEKKREWRDYQRHIMLNRSGRWQCVGQFCSVSLFKPTPPPQLSVCCTQQSANLSTVRLSTRPPLWWRQNLDSSEKSSASHLCPLQSRCWVAQIRRLSLRCPVNIGPTCALPAFYPAAEWCWRTALLQMRVNQAQLTADLKRSLKCVSISWRVLKWIGYNVLFQILDHLPLSHRLENNDEGDW